MLFRSPRPPACDHYPVNLPIAILGKLYGRGATDDKGPVAGWINALEAFQKTKQVRGPRPATRFTGSIWWCAVGLSVPGAIKIKDHTPPRPPWPRAASVQLGHATLHCLFSSFRKN